MSVYYYLVARRPNEQEALIVFLGSSIDDGYTVLEQKRLTELIENLDDKVEEIDIYKNVKEMTINDFLELAYLVKLVDDLKYGDWASTYGSIYVNMKVWGLIEALYKSVDKDFKWEIVSDYKLDEIEEELKNKKYKILRWY